MSNNNSVINQTTINLQNLINDRMHFNIDLNLYQECANFLFLTSWFEELLFTNDTRQCPKYTKIISEELAPLINMECFKNFRKHFTNRYVEIGNPQKKPTKFFTNLGLKNEDDLVFTTLSDFGKDTKAEDLLFSYLLISYRFRNNMFHGNKGMINLSKYATEFSIINQFFIDLIKQILEKGYKGFNAPKEVKK